MFAYMSAILDQAFLKRTNLKFFTQLDESSTRAHEGDSRCVRLWQELNAKVGVKGSRVDLRRGDGMLSIIL